MNAITKALLDIDGAAEYLSLSRRSVERLVEREEVETVRLPGIRKVLFRVQDLDRMVSEFRSVPASVPALGHIRAVSGGNRRK